MYTECKIITLLLKIAVPYCVLEKKFLQEVVIRDSEIMSQETGGWIDQMFNIYLSAWSLSYVVKPKTGGGVQTE